MPDKPIDKEKRKFIRKMDEQMAPLFQKCVLPIFAVQNGSPVQCGTGTLFRVAGRPFIVTAWHVAAISTKDNIQLYVSDCGQGARAAALHGEVHVMTEDRCDVALCELPDEVVRMLSNRSFLNLSQIDRTLAPLKKGWFYIHGYPTCWSKPNKAVLRIGTQALTYGTVLYAGRADALNDYQPQLHILLDVSRSDNWAPDDGDAAVPGDLGGISGCSIWQAYAQGQGQDAWTPDLARVVAVETCLCRMSARHGETQGCETLVIRGTRWAAVFELLRRKYPKLEPALRLRLP
jgi:hypothetical protein